MSSTRSGSARTRTSSRSTTICDKRDGHLRVGLCVRPAVLTVRCQRVLLASPGVVPTEQGGTCLGCWLLRRRGKFQLDGGGGVWMCGHQPGEQGAARTLPTGSRGTRQDLWAVRNATQGPLVKKAAMGVPGSSSRARTSDRRDAVVQARLHQEAAGGRGAQTLSEPMPSRSSQESWSPGLPAVRSKRLEIGR